MTIPVAILCGGKGTRAESSINKCFIEVVGKPFILWVIENVERYGLGPCVLLRGDSGTLAAVQESREYLGDRFLLLYGDTYLPIDYRDFLAKWEESGKSLATAIYNGVDAGVHGVVNASIGTAFTDPSFEWYKDLMSQLDAVYHYETPIRWHEVGTPEALAETRQWFGEHEPDWV